MSHFVINNLGQYTMSALPDGPGSWQPDVFDASYYTDQHGL